MSKVLFQPVRTTEEKIKDMPRQEGYIYFTSDGGKIYMDTATERVGMGAAGVAIYYGDVELKQDEDIVTYTLPKDKVQGNAKVDDLIFNSDGGFYKVISVEADSYTCTLLAVSGGLGGGTKVTSPSISINVPSIYKTLINGQEGYFHVDAESSKDSNDKVLDTSLSVTYKLYVKGEDKTGLPYFEETLTFEDLEGGVLSTDIEFGSKLRASTNSTLTVQVSGDNHGAPSALRTVTEIITSQLTLSQVAGYSPTQRYDVGNVKLYCQIVGSINKLAKVYFDDMETPIIQEYYTSDQATVSGNYSVPSNLATHGTHLVKIELYQVLYTDATTGEYVLGNSVTPLKYEIPVVANDATAKPVIWLGEYQEVYYTYDTIIIPFLAYDPASTVTATVHLCKDKIEIEGGTRNITDFSNFSTWEIADAEQDAENNYSIWCGTTNDRRVEREFSIKVVKDPNRDMEIAGSADMALNFNAVGRNNSESAAKRASWSYKLGDETKYATFENFNWHNNGWASDDAIKTSCLRISNGAKFTIPFKSLTFGSDVAGSISHTIEMQLKIKNIQRYGTLITNVTRYEGDDVEGGWYDQFLNQTEYNNYDAFLQATLDAETYDNLVFRQVEKMIDMNNIVGGLYTKESEKSVVGVCIGTEDTFFSNGTDTVNVNFVENSLLNLSFVYQHGLKSLYIYINGVITGVIKSTKDNFTINSTEFVFDSTYCDIDLYKLRVFHNNLNVSQIVNNFAVDRKDVNIYDQNALAIENAALQEYQLDFKLVENHNLNHPSNPTMPYIIYHTGDENSKLSYSKADVQNIRVEFVNAPLEYAYTSGELKTLAIKDGLLSDSETDPDVIQEAVKTYYKHHCPSWTSSIRDTDRVSFEVQGTSSQFYPRRNYKIKTKMEGKYCWMDNEDIEDEEDKDYENGGIWSEEEMLNIFMHKGPYAEIYTKEKALINSGEAGRKEKYGYEECRLADGWYLNNYTNGTDRWTMKVDYMESSGSYNAGFASLVGNGYTKHPLQDYMPFLSGTAKLKPIVNGVPTDDDGMRWEDYRTSLLGFPVMAFQKRGEGDSAIYTFIGYYRMLLDKSSREVLGYKPHKNVVNKLFPDGLDDNGNPKYKRVRDTAECWEFSNNARGFCSYRDPWNRVQLSFLAPETVTEGAYTADDAPVVCNSFEYRYHALDDAIDVFYNYKENASKTDVMKEACEALGVPEFTAGDKLAAAKALMTTHANWEKFCQWVWSTNLDAVPSQGSYEKVRLGTVKFDATKHYIINENGVYVLATEYSDDQTYYELVPKTSTTADEEGNEVIETKNEYVIVDAVPEAQIYKKNTFYYLASGEDTTNTDDDVYALCADDAFSGSITYYKFTSLTEDKLDKLADLLVAPAEGDFDSSVTYYTYDGSVTINPTGPTGAVAEVAAGSANEADFLAGKYYVARPVTFNGVEFTHDTKEYRAAKFVGEFEKHIDPEYAATYFIMTEVMECYDSRGKNCMMASWGPHEEGGEYIWYPVFYDIDTQLGINNTGIPSFEFNVDATEANNFSTSDSILWNNMYKLLRNTYIVPKYKNLRGWESSFDKLLDKDSKSIAPLQSVEYIEKWYTFDPEITKNIACRGIRPLIATNLDMYFKYITITNAAAKSQGVAHLNDQGDYAEPDSGTYFYALQGDRSQSRQQFVSSRLEYIDSWLTVGNYARGGANRLWGRISANDRSDITGDGIGTHSDKWTEDISNADKTYWIDKEFGTKRHEFDAEYWLEPKPIRSAYVTAGDDSANYPSQKYDGITDMKFKLAELENGIRRSNNYPEQLLYIYGTNQMSDFGDLSKMYWTEFKLEGNADKLTRLKLGHDGTTEDYASDTAQENGESKTTIRWYNNKLNGITLPTLPLLKEANFSNIGCVNETALDFTASEKLRNFRAAGASNITSVAFAPGVALDTLYLPSSVLGLKLTQANLLTDLIKNAEDAIPTTEDNGDLTATEGLYLEGFFSGSSSLNTVNLDGGALGYHSYEILSRLYSKYTGNGKAYVTMKDVNWCPYTHLTEGDVYESDKTYYVDDGHYGFSKYTYASQKKFNADVLSGILYRDDGFGGRDNGAFSSLVTSVNDTALTILRELVTNTVNFSDAASSSIRPQITGTIYINNSTDNPIEESEVATLQASYPNLTFFFANVTKAYSAKFINYNEDDFSYTYVKHADGSTSPSVQKISAEDYAANNNIFFTSPYPVTDADGNTTGYNPEKTHYDFKGWCLLKDDGTLDKTNIITEAAWANLRITASQYDYIYCAVFEIHPYVLTFVTPEGEWTKKVNYGENVVIPDEIPYKDDSQLGLLETYNFKGYSLTANGDVQDVTALKVTSDRTFYAQFELIKDIRQVTHPEWFKATSYTYTEKSILAESDYTLKGICLEPAVTLKGKVTIPRQWTDENGTQDVIAIQNFTTNGLNVTHVFMEKPKDDTTLAPLVAVHTNCFNDTDSSLKYFDFGGSSIRGVFNAAFRVTPLDFSLTSLNVDTLIGIANNAFNSCGNGSPVDIILPGSLKTAGPNSFRNLNIGTGSTLTIGSKDHPSELDLSLSVSSSAQRTKFSPEYNYSTINFYSSRYSGDDFVMNISGTDLSVYDFFTDELDTDPSLLPTFNFE